MSREAGLPPLPSTQDPSGINLKAYHHHRYNYIKFSIKIMFKLKSPHKTRPLVQKQKLNKLLSSFEANSHSSYKIIAHRGILHTVIDDNLNFFAEEASETEEMVCLNNCEQVVQESKKKMGLFGNIIRNMEAKKLEQENSKQVKRSEKPKSYTFYFAELDHKNKKGENHMNRPNTAETQENYFDNIEIARQMRPQYHRDSNKENQNTTPQGEQYIDMNFSFDEISKHMQSIKEGQGKDRLDQRRNEDTIIHKYLNQNSEAEAENSRSEVKLSRGSKAIQKQSIERLLISQKNRVQSINFAKLSKQHKASDPQLPPAPLKPKSSISKGPIKECSALEGTKKVESRIFQANTMDPHSINIDFDLDINFI